MATYDNAAANVDLGIRQVVESFRAAISGRDHAIMVLSDHGQALFEPDFLGHGQALTQDQTRTPFILWGVGGDWPEPLGVTDIRGLLQRNLFLARGRETPRARFVPDPNRRLFLFVANIQRPHIIGLQTLAGLTSFHFGRVALESYDRSGSLRALDAAQESAAFEELIHTWEAIQAEASLQISEDAESPGPA